jgi:uncharacterized membrane protein YdjX (TVP38/TMEM64 family)
MNPTGMLQRQAAKVRWTALVIIGLSLLALARVVPVQELLDSLQHWLDGLGPLGIVVFAAVYVLAALMFVPGSVLTAASGALFGLVWGTAAVSAASTLAAALAFLIARHLARDAVERKAATNLRFRAIDRAIGEGGWRIIALLRMSPAIPFSLGNYLFGLTPVRFWPYIVASWLAMLPGTFLYVYLGYVGRQGLTAAGGSTAASPGQLALLVAGLVATGVVIVYVTRLARRALRDSAEIDTQGAPSGTPHAVASGRSALVMAAAAVLLAGTAVYAILHREDLRSGAKAAATSGSIETHQPPLTR